MTDKRDETAGPSVTQVQRDVTDERDTSRARPPLEGCHGVTRDDDTPLERDTSAQGPSVTREEHAVSVEPWPSYDGHGNDWWRVRVVGRSGRFTLAWSRALSRFADCTDKRRLCGANARLLRGVEQQMRDQLGAKTKRTEHEAHRAKLMADPRFAGWAAGSKA